MTSELEGSVSSRASIRSIRAATGSGGGEQGAVENSVGGEEGEGGNRLGATSTEDHQLHSSGGSLVEEGVPLDVQEGDILNIGDYDVITPAQEGPSSGAGAAVGVSGDSEVSSGVDQEPSTDIGAGERVSLRESSPSCDGDSMEELDQAVESGGQSQAVESSEGGAQSSSAGPEKRDEEEDIEETGPQRVPSRPSTLLGRTSSVFIKYEEEGVGLNEEGAGSLNQWGVYQAWRLLQIKAAWMRPLRRKAAAAQQRDSTQ